MNLYIISGLGADHKVLDKIAFPENLEVHHIPWLIPEKEEAFKHYVMRMAEGIDVQTPFYLLGYSFGGIMVQEIHKIKPAKKVVILGSIKSHGEKSLLMKVGAYTKLPHLLPRQLYTERATVIYTYLRKFIDPTNPKILDYFTVRDPYYLKWSIEKVADWKHAEDPEVIQINADQDIVFPIKNSKPDYVIKNASHLFPVSKHKEVSTLLQKILKE